MLCMLFPVNSNITCTGCDLITKDCDSCECDLCMFIPFVDDKEYTKITKSTFIYSVIIMTVFGMGMSSALCMCFDHRSKLTSTQGTS